MRVIMAGASRVKLGPEQIDSLLTEAGFQVTEFVCSCTKGVSTSGERWAESRGIPIAHFPAERTRYGRAAAPLRNVAMVRYAAQDDGGLVAVLGSAARNAWDLVSRARALGLKIHLVRDL
jgi:hypothetical protein